MLTQLFNVICYSILDKDLFLYYLGLVWSIQITFLGNKDVIGEFFQFMRQGFMEVFQKLGEFTLTFTIMSFFIEN